MNLSFGTLFAGAVLPGLLLAWLYLIYFLVLDVMRSAVVPAVPLAQHQPIPAREHVARPVKVALPPLGLVITVLGSPLRSLPSPPADSVNRGTDYMARDARSISGT